VQQSTSDQPVIAQIICHSFPPGNSNYTLLLSMVLRADIPRGVLEGHTLSGWWHFQWIHICAFRKPKISPGSPVVKWPTYHPQ